MTQRHQPDYDKILSPITEINTSIEALLEGAFGALMGDQREGLKGIYASSWGLHTLLMDIITSIGIENIARRTYLGEKFDAVIDPIIDISKALLDGMDGPMSEEQVPLVDYIYQTGNLLRVYMDSLWLYSRTLHKQIPIKHEYFSVSDALRMLSLPVSQDDVAIEYALPSDLPLIHGDEVATRIIMQQVIQNAIESTKRGYIRVSAVTENNRIRIEVEDSGTGILPEQQARIFDAFFQGDAGKQGIGLGLGIALGLAQQQNGNVELRHSSPDGSLFVVTLPTA